MSVFRLPEVVTAAMRTRSPAVPSKVQVSMNAGAVMLTPTCVSPETISPRSAATAAALVSSRERNDRIRHFLIRSPPDLGVRRRQA